MLDAHRLAACASVSLERFHLGCKGSGELGDGRASNARPLPFNAGGNAEQQKARGDPEPWACAARLSGLGFAMLLEVIFDDFHQFPLVDGELSRK